MPYPLIWCFDDWWWSRVLCCSMLQNLPYCTFICSFEFQPADSPETMIHNIPTDVKQSLTPYACMEASAFLKFRHTFIQVCRWTCHPILFLNTFLSTYQRFPSAFLWKQPGIDWFSCCRRVLIHTVAEEWKVFGLKIALSPSQLLNQ